MAEEVTRYVVAVRRERRGAGVTTDALRLIDGVVFKGGTSQLAVIEAGPKVARSLRRKFGGDLLIEAELRHSPS